MQLTTFVSVFKLYKETEPDFIRFFKSEYQLYHPDRGFVRFKHYVFLRVEKTLYFAEVLLDSGIKSFGVI